MGKSTINGPFSDNSYVELPEGTSQVLVVSQLPKIKRCSDLHPKITKLDRNVIFQTHESGVLCWIKGVCNLRQPNLAMNKKTTDDVPIKEMAVHKGWKKTRSIRDFTLHITFFLKHHFPTIFPYAFSPDISGWLNPWFSYGIFATISPRDLPQDLTLRWLGTFLGRDGDQGQGGKGSHG